MVTFGQQLHQLFVLNKLGYLAAFYSALSLQHVLRILVDQLNRLLQHLLLIWQLRLQLLQPALISNYSSALIK